MKKFIRALFFLTPFFQNNSAKSQPNTYQDEILVFKTKDSLQFPQDNSILFIGSSSIRLWNTLQDDFAGYPVLNRGFGGACLPDLLLYSNKIIFPYHPKQIIIYCGENDLTSDAITADTVFSRFVNLYDTIRAELDSVPIVFISMKPSVSRSAIIPKITEGNAKIKQFIDSQKYISYVDVYSKMLTKDLKPDPTLFSPDMLHMNEKGYAIWKETIQPYLIK